MYMRLGDIGLFWPSRLIYVIWLLDVNEISLFELLVILLNFLNSAKALKLLSVCRIFGGKFLFANWILVEIHF